MKRLAILALVLWTALAQAFTADIYNAQCLGSNFTTTSTTPTATNLSIILKANSHYAIEGSLSAQASAATGMKYTFTGPTSAVALDGWLESTLANLGAVSRIRITSLNTAFGPVHTASSLPGPDRFWIHVHTGASGGAMTIKAASVVAGVTTTIFAGSWWRVREGNDV